MSPEKEQQAKEELKDMYGKEFDGYLFEDAMEETDKLLEGKVAVREEEIEVNRDMNERRRQWSNAGLINFFAE